ncbi:hypothetical protein RI129_012811 [Pyrocoelia pectoralis]|uniref:Ionotropic glutamate receptor C-terminal domain-containing protein n=1 Tax=Pyrocoelia pectoralis TaxID=417401 RepID=A0AAN7V3L6_9COLE
MNALIFVTWLYFQILLVQCDIFGNNNLNGSDPRIKMCIQKTINHLFSHNDTLNLILNNNTLCEDAIFEMTTMRPYIVLKLDNITINDINKLQYDGQFIICPKDVSALSREIHTARHIAFRHKRDMGNSKFLVITNTTLLSRVFNVFWHYGINKVISLVYGQGTTKLVTYNRYAPENECGRTKKIFIDHGCEEQLLSLSFTNVIHQMNKCPITFQFTPGSVFQHDDNPTALAILYFTPGTVFQYDDNPTALAILYVLEELSHHLNATFQKESFIGNRNYNDLIKNTSIIILLSQTTPPGSLSVTEPLVRSDILWMVPIAKQIFNMNDCLQVFNYDVWIATSVVFICVWLMWFLIVSRNGGFTFDKLCISFLNVWSLTICGNVVSQLPRSLALRIILLFYLIYVIHIQCAFTSDMSTVLTTPRYDFQIRNLKDLADSQLPIYAHHDCKIGYFSKNNTDRKLYTKLQNSIHGEPPDEYIYHLRNLDLNGSYAVITSLEEMRPIEINLNKKIEAYQIRDNIINSVYSIRFCMLIDHYFLTTLSTFISRLVESGIHDKRKNDFYNQGQYYTEKAPKMEEDDAITLKHLVFIFIFLGIGLCTACVVFCFELVLNKYLYL